MRKLAPRLLLLLGGTILALSIGEVLVRVFWEDLRPLRDVEINYPMAFPAPVTGLEFGFIPGSEFVGKYDGDPYGTLPENHAVRYAINETGFRDRPFPGRIDGEAFTIMVVGDSFAFGEGVARGERFTEVMGAALSQKLGEPVETLNCAVSGYASRDESGLVRKMVPWLEPDVVLLAYCLNDPIHLFDEEYPAFDLIMLRDLGRETDPSPDSPLYLWRFLQQRLGVRRVTATTLDWYRKMYVGASSPWARSRAYLQEMKEVARQHGAEFAVAIQPILSEVGGDYPLAGAHSAIKHWCEKKGIRVIDLQPAFAGMDARSLVVHPKDHHPNARAHRIMGEALADFLMNAVIRR